MPIDISKLSSKEESLHKLIASLDGKNQYLLEKNNNWSSKYHELSKKTTALVARNKELSDQINKLEEQLKRLKAKRFGKSSEKLEHQIDIVERLLEEEETLLGFQSKESFNVEDNIKEKGQAKRKKLPSHLPREEVILEPEERCDSCGGKDFRKIGEDVSEI